MDDAVAKIKRGRPFLRRLAWSALVVLVMALTYQVGYVMGDGQF